MAFSKVAVVLSAFLAVFVLAMLMTRGKRVKGVVTYTIGNDEIDEDSELLHIEQVLLKVPNESNLTVVHVGFPHNGLGYVITLVKVQNYNSKYTEEELQEDDKENENFWVLLSDGEIGSDWVTVEINSFEDIDVDVEFYGYVEDS